MTIEELLQSLKVKTTIPTGKYGVDSSLDRLMQKVESMEEHPRIMRMSQIHKRVAIAATVALLIAIGGLAYMLSNRVTPEYSEVTNVSGKVKQVLLADGSKVDLNVGSKIIYAKKFRLDKREVFLTGEAYFNVSKDRSKPFIVRTGDISIHVLGTKFNVKAYLNESDITTTLLEGSVLIDNSSTGKKQQLIPNDVYSYNQVTKAATLVNSANSSANISWRYGAIRMEQMRMDEVCQQLERVYNVKIIILNNKLKQKRFTGELNYNENLMDILEILKITVPFKYSVNQQTYIIR